MFDELKKALKPELRLQITVWDPDDESVEHVFNSVILEHAGAMLRIAPPPTTEGKAINPFMRKGLVVGVVMETYPAPFIFYPIINDTPQNVADGYWLTIPENTEVEVFQRRRHVRIPMTVTFELEFPIGQSTLSIQAQTCDVSGGGMLFTSSRTFPKQQELWVHLQFDPEQPKMRLRAIVVFSRENRTQKGKNDKYATACQFIGLDAAQEMLLVRECFRCELTRKKSQK